MKSKGRPTSYRPEFCTQVIELMAKGFSLDACAGFLGFSPDTLYRWQHAYSAFSEAIAIGRSAGIAYWETRLLEIAEGGPGHAGTAMWALRNRSRAACGWDHAHARVEVTGRDGEAIPVQVAAITIDARQLSEEQRHTLRQVLIAARDQALSKGVNK